MNTKQWKVVVIACGMLFSLTGCTGVQDSRAHSRTYEIYPEGVKSVSTGAQERLINIVRVEQNGGKRRVDPRYIICAEPSPDVAKAVADILSLGASLDLHNLPAKVSPELALAYNRSQTEGLAMLTQRLATIQLLRDGLYRACEAYANGAISATDYALLLSRYDDTMITMLMGELAAGSAPRMQFAAAPEQNLSQTLEQGKEGNRTAIRTTITGITPPSTARTEIQSADSREKVAETIQKIQQKYIENINHNAFEIACISVLSDEYDDSNASLLARICREGDLNATGLGKIQERKHDMFIRLLEFKLKQQNQE